MKSVLIVDDSAVIRKAIARILAGFNFKQEFAEDGSVALEKCREQIPDLILLDWNMPVMDGYEFLLEFRKLPGSEMSKVIFCTTENEIDKIITALDGGADEFIMKPFTKEIIGDKLIQVGLINEF